MSNGGRGRLRAITGYDVDWLADGWEVGASAPGAIASPDELSAAALDWNRTVVPSTVASAARAVGEWSLDSRESGIGNRESIVPSAVRRFDADDWWYRTRFVSEPVALGEELWLCFDGLATVADVWLNGQPLLSSSGMFTAHERRIDHLVRSENELLIRFQALDALLAVRRRRPRWRAPMVEHQQLRWFRTTLLGRTPGWSPPAAAVGPWRGVRLERRRGVTIEDVRLNAGGDGTLDVSCRVTGIGTNDSLGAVLNLERDGQTVRADLSAIGDRGRLGGRVLVPDVQRWWPHTHGAAPLYTARVSVRHSRGTTDADLGSVGFRSLSLVTAGDDFAIHVNGTPVFARGACWTPLDPVSLNAAPDAVEQSFAQMVDAGMNMVRVGGTMVYESDAFLDQCDANGVMLWQDFMFANMDYPEDDPEFIETVEIETRRQLARLQGRPCLAILCGNSEVEQQAAMWGAMRERWAPALFHQRLATLARESCPDVPYTPSSTHGGAFPHQGNVGATSYYGVGAYRRPLEDARRAEVRFASECLAFANIPTVRASTAPSALGAEARYEMWKARVPRDAGAAWDFDDVRDHYLGTLFRVDPAQLRSDDRARYLELGRVATGEVMAAVFSEWRRQRSVTRGGLVWFLRDLWAGAGWGVVDAEGVPKAAWYYLRRAFAPVAMSLSDEGGNGIGVHVANDPPEPLVGELELVLYRNGDVQVARGAQPITVAPHSAIELNAGALFDGFFDLSYAYRFGPPSHEVIAATVRDATGIRAKAFHFIPGLPNVKEADVGLAGVLCRVGSEYELLVRAQRFAQSVCVDVDGYSSDDNFFHLAPGEERRLRLHRILEPMQREHGDPPQRTVRALNAEQAVAVALES
jgi:beta-mannosidase